MRMALMVSVMYSNVQQQLCKLRVCVCVWSVVPKPGRKVGVVSK